MGDVAPQQTRLFSFPNPVNEVAARVVAGVVAVTAAASLLVPWLMVPLVYGFWARVLTGPTLSPLGQFATRVAAPRLAAGPRLVPGPPKRFAQGMGAGVSTAAGLLYFIARQHAAADLLLAALVAAAALEAGFAFCLGCKIFAALMKLHVIPAAVCAECTDLTANVVGR